MKNRIVRLCHVSLLVFCVLCLQQSREIFAQEADNGQKDKPSVAIKEAKISDGIPESVRKHLNLEKLQQEMEASFVAARKFNVVTRSKESLGAVREEQKFAESDLAAGDAAQSGQLKNADYLIIPEVHIFSFSTTTNKVPNLQNKYFRKDQGVLEVNAQVIDTAGGQIMTTFYLKDSFGTKESMVNSAGGVPSAENFSKMAKTVSAQMVDQFLNLVFPVEIINIKGDTAYLNRGQDGGFKVDDVYSVYSKGEALVDPQTGEQLGSAEELVGKIKIAKVNPKFTLATILRDKSKGDVAVGCIIRKN